MPTWEITKIHHMNPLRTNPLRTWGYLAHNSHLFHIALKNPRVGWKFINRFLSNGSAVPQNAPCSFPGERRPVGANERNVGSWLVWGPPPLNNIWTLFKVESQTFSSQEKNKSSLK